MMCSICGSVSVPSGFDGSGRSPAARRTVVVVVLTDDELDASDRGADELDPFEHPFTAKPTAPAPSPVRNVRLESMSLFLAREKSAGTARRVRDGQRRARTMDGTRPRPLEHVTT